MSWQSRDRSDLHLHSYEESFFVLEGETTLTLDGSAVRVTPGTAG